MTNYASAGVHLDRAAAAKKRIAAAARTTFNAHVLTDVGHFGGFFALSDDPQADVLVASADGVGTKLLLGAELGRVEGLGRDLVHHCINDILMCGARPLFFLDYMAFGKLDPEIAATLAESLASACRENGVALIGGETAEMPGLYEEGHFDLAGTIIGRVRRDQILDGSRVRSGDVMLGVASNGLHTNGYSLARRVFAASVANKSANTRRLANGETLAEALLKSHKCYLNSVGTLLDQPGLHALSHITGGGLVENTERVIPKGMHLDVDWSAWQLPEVFHIIQQEGAVSDEEMRRVFNIGIGVVVICTPDAADRFRAQLERLGETVYQIGHVIA